MSTDFFTISIPPLACGQLIWLFSVSDKVVRVDRPEYQFDALALDRSAQIEGVIFEKLEELLGPVVELRIHRFAASDYANMHVDDVHPGHDAVIVRLDGYGSNERLSVLNEAGDSVNLTERYANGFLLPEGTPHAVSKDDENPDRVRFTLVGWYKPKGV